MLKERKLYQGSAGDYENHMKGIQPARIVGLQTKRRLHLLIPHSPEGWKVSGIATNQHAHQEKNTLTKNDLRCVGKL